MLLKKIFILFIFLMNVSLFAQEVKTARVIGGPVLLKTGV
jgi:hypothetical protein